MKKKIFESALLGIIMFGNISCEGGKRYGSDIEPLRTDSGSSLYQEIIDGLGGAPRTAEIEGFLERLRDKEKEKYKILILTDEPGGTKAHEIANGFRTQRPWSLFDIEIEVLEKTSEELECAEGETIKRLITANRGLASREASNHDADQSMIVCNMNFGGAGGDIPVIAADNEAVETAFHEFMHTLGFSDEYKYSADEASIYCTDIEESTRINLAHITPEQSYVDDASARSLHRGQIPWYPHILSSTLITHGTELGSSAADQHKFGLFEAETCVNANITMWKPGGARSIMQSTSKGTTINGIYSTLVFDIMADMGVPLRDLPTTESHSNSVRDSSRTPSEGSVAHVPPVSSGSAVRRQ